MLCVCVCVRGGGFIADIIISSIDPQLLIWTIHLSEYLVSYLGQRCLDN